MKQFMNSANAIDVIANQEYESVYQNVDQYQYLNGKLVFSTVSSLVTATFTLFRNTLIFFFLLGFPTKKTINTPDV